MPQHITAESNAIDYLDLFLDNDFWELLSLQTTLRAGQIGTTKKNTGRNSLHCVQGILNVQILDISH